MSYFAPFTYIPATTDRLQGSKLCLCYIAGYVIEEPKKLAAGGTKNDNFVG